MSQLGGINAPKQPHWADCLSSKVVDLTDIEKLSLHTITLLLINLPAIQVHMAWVNNDLFQLYCRS